MARFARLNPAAIHLAIVLLPALFAPAADTPTRTPWTTNHITGTPDPPPAFRVERLYPKLRFREPTDIDFLPNSDRLFILEKAGKIFSFPRAAADRPDLAADLTQLKDRWKSTLPTFRGFDSLYGIAFHPRFAQNHFVYLCYALNLGPRREEPVGSRVSRFTVSPDSPPKIDLVSEQVILEWQAGGHNGGCIKFGHDGMLYISTGDQADPNPPDVYNTGQDISDLRASILRIDVDHPEKDRLYSIPRDNPFVSTPNARGEVWSYGLRNPWRMTFDRATGNLWVADVGWELWEMVYCAKPGGNYGWSAMEGPNPVRTDLPRGPTPISPPQLALSHAESASITGGFVYHGKRFPQLVGHYVFGDWMTRRIWAAQLTAPDKLAPQRTIAQTDLRVVAFAEDADGELYVLDHEGGGIYALAPNKAAGHPTAFPRTLRDTGLFADVPNQSPAPGVVRFTPKAPQWVDGATTEWFVAVPGTRPVGWRTDDVYQRLQLAFPKDSVLVRTFSLPLAGGSSARTQKIETQLLHFDGVDWRGYSYRWRDDGSDADLVPENGADRPLLVHDPAAPGGHRPQTWHYQARAQCMTCHTAWSAYALAYTQEQLDGPAASSDSNSTDKQLHHLRALSLFPDPFPGKKGGPSKPPVYSLVNPYDPAADLEQRARSYLHVNCSVCHRMGGGGSALIDLRKEMTPKQTHAMNERPMLGAFGIDEARILAPGDPARSVLLYRMSKTGSGRMPKIGSDLVDDRGVALIAQWLAAMPPATASGSATANTTDKPDTTDAALAKSLATTRGALALAWRLRAGDITGDARNKLISRGTASPSPDVRDLFESLAAPGAATRPRLGPKFDRAKLLAMPGDAARGREVFEKSAQCASCHLAPGVAGRAFGPDLTHIASKYTREQLLEQIVEPSKTIADGFTGHTVQTTDGDALSGLLERSDPTEIVIKDATGQSTHIPRAQVKSVTPQTLSIMPEGLLDALEPQQAADLLEFVASQK